MTQAPSITTKLGQTGIFVILVIALALRCIGLSHQTLSMDEWYELDLAQKSATEIIQDADGFPPAYSLIVSQVIHVFGDHAARWFSLIVGLITVYIVGDIGHHLAGLRGRYGAMLFMAFSPVHIWHSQEARAYSLLMLVAAVTIKYGLQLLANPRDRYAFGWFIISASLGIFTHYLFIVPVALMLGMVLFAHQLNAIKLCVVSLLVFGILGTAWLPLLKGDLYAQVAWPNKHKVRLEAVGYTYYSTATGFSLGPSLRDLHTLEAASVMRMASPWLAAVGIACLLIVGGVPVDEWKNRQVAACVCLLCAPIVVAAMAIFADVDFRPRHVNWITIPFFCLLGWACSRGWEQRTVRLGMLILLVLMCISVYNRLAVDRYQNPDLRSVAGYLSEHDAINSPTIVISSYMAPVLEYYSGQPIRVWRQGYLIPRPERFDAFKQAVDDAQEQSTDLWIVYVRDFHEDAEGDYLEHLRNRYDRIEPRGDFAGVQLFRASTEGTQIESKQLGSGMQPHPATLSRVGWSSEVASEF